MKKISVTLLILGLIFFMCSATAKAIPFNFEKLENNTTLSGSQFSGDAVAVDDQVKFTIGNVGIFDSTIFTVYFDDPDSMPLLDSIVEVSWEGTASFTGAPNSGNLPGGNNAIPPFPNPADFEVDRDGRASNGIDPGESLMITFGLMEDTSFNDVEFALIAGTLRIGLHVGRIDPNLVNPEMDDSDSFISTPVPEPATMLLFGTGLIGMAAIGRKKFFKK